MEDRHTNNDPLQPAKVEEDGAPDTSADLIAGWAGGAAGILISNPLEVLKVRLQTARTTTPVPSLPPTAARVGRSNPPLPASVFPPKPLHPQAFTHNISNSTLRQVTPPAPGLVSLWRAEGARFLFAGAAGPILGLAFIDSAFFGIYGKAMQGLHQDRQDPSQLSRVFLAGATAGALCAMLETPIEVVKCRAQVEPPAADGTKLGSYRIAKMIAQAEGLRGFYVGGLVTAIHDGIASGGFFAAYFVLRRALRGDAMLTPAPIPRDVHPLEDRPAPPPGGGGMDRWEIGRILIAGGVAGAVSAFVPYPLDIIKTRLQTSNFGRAASSAASSSSSTASTSAAATPRHATPSATITPASAASPSRYLSSSSSTSAPPRPPPSAASLPALSIRAVAREIYHEGLAERSRCPTEGVGRVGRWAERLGGLRAFSRGLGSTLGSSFVGCAVTITVFEVVVAALGAEGGGGGLG